LPLSALPGGATLTGMESAPSTGTRQGSRTVKTLSTLLAVAALCAIGAGSALAHPTTTPKTVTVVMHDPGCHWFAVGGKLLTTLTVTGPVRLANVDEAALRVHVVGVSSRGDRIDQVGGWVRLDRGSYAITMLGQAPDDNHLKLTVR
jgi:hypothetical protein